MHTLTLKPIAKPVIKLTIKQGLAVYQLPNDKLPNAPQTSNDEPVIDLLAHYILAKS